MTDYTRRDTITVADKTLANFKEVVAMIEKIEELSPVSKALYGALIENPPNKTKEADVLEEIVDYLREAENSWKGRSDSGKENPWASFLGKELQRMEREKIIDGEGRILNGPAFASSEFLKDGCCRPAGWMPRDLTQTKAMADYTRHDPITVAEKTLASFKKAAAVMDKVEELSPASRVVYRALMEDPSNKIKEADVLKEVIDYLREAENSWKGRSDSGKENPWASFLGKELQRMEREKIIDGEGRILNGPAFASSEFLKDGHCRPAGWIPRDLTKTKAFSHLCTPLQIRRVQRSK